MKIKQFQTKPRGTIKTKLIVVLALWALSILNPQRSNIFAQSTFFTYQGQLSDATGPVSGSYDLTFTLFYTNNAGAAIAGPVTNSAIRVSNGLFMTVIDFGASVFNGADCWLEIAVRTNSGSAFTTLGLRQQITSMPYAIKAGGVLAGGIATGNYTNAVTFGNPNNSFLGSFSGNLTATNGNVVTYGQYNGVEVTVSAYGIKNGCSISNNGAVLGIDCPNSQTYGVAEYLSSIAKQTSFGATNFNAIKFKFSPGIFYFTSGIWFSNSVTFALTFEGAGEAATRIFLNSTASTPILRIDSQPYDGSQTVGGTHLELHDMTFTALNSKSKLITITNYSKLVVERCGFFIWEAFTNTQTGANLSIYANGVNQMTNLPCEGLVGLAYFTGGEIATIIRDSQFFGLAVGIQGYSDHLICEGNTFGQIGQAPRFATNLWPTTEELSLGACFLGSQNISGIFRDNHLYMSKSGIVFNTGGIGLNKTIISDLINEGTQNAIAIDYDQGLICENSGTGIQKLDSPTSGFTAQPNWSFGGTIESLNCILYDADANTGRFFVSGIVSGNGSGIKNLVPHNFAPGILPGNVFISPSSLPGITTNISVSGSTMYITNGQVMRISVP